MVITGWEKKGLCKRATPAALLIYIASRGGGVSMNHPRDREDTAEDVSLNLNAAVYQLLLIPSQVTAPPAVQPFITEDTSSVQMKQVGWIYQNRTHECRCRRQFFSTDFTGTKSEFMQIIKHRNVVFRY